MGYVESWRINFEQFGRLICQVPFSASNENVETGNIAYVANTWIAPKHRQKKVYKWLKEMFFDQNDDCDYFVGEALRKKTQPVKVFNRAEVRRMIGKGVNNG